MKPRFYNSFMRFYATYLKRIGWLHALFYFFGDKVVRVGSWMTGFATRSSDPLSWRLALVTGGHEPDTRELFARLIRPGMTVLDVGAHIGYYTRQFSTLVGASGRVIAFEPHPRNFEFLRRNVGRRRNVTLIQKAAYSSAGKVTLFDDMADTGGPSLRRDQRRAHQVQDLRSAKELAPRAAANSVGSEFEVDATTIDETLATLGVDTVDVVKMDIEGAEMGALRGMEGVLERSVNIAVVLELYPAAMEPFQVEPLQVWRWLSERGFEVSRIAGPDEMEPLTNEEAARRLIETLEQRRHEANLVALRR